MDREKEFVRISKYLSLVLRHQPEKLGIVLDEQGWTDIATLLEKLNGKGLLINRDVLEQVVATNNKNRFAFNEDKTRIRANQGHSIAIDLQFQPQKPPTVLYHGTGEKAVSSILRSGLNKGNRHHVHLSIDIQTAILVGQRKGKPVVFTIEALKMYEQGFAFFVSQNGVWLTDFVPVAYLYITS